MTDSDPFRAGADVRAYVPTEDVEQSLAYLEAKLAQGERIVGICGPPGVGKTLVLRLLMQRMRDRLNPVYVPSAYLTAEEVADWIAAHGHAARRETVVELARRYAGNGRPLLIALDEAQIASESVVAFIDELCGKAGAQAVFAWTLSGAVASAPALRRCSTRVFLEPLQIAQVAPYVAALMANAEASEAQRTVFGERTLARIALASGGNHREIQRLADAELLAHAWRTRASAAPEAALPATSAPLALPVRPRPITAPSGPPVPAPAARARRSRRALRWLLPLVAAIALGAWLALRLR